MYRVTRSLKAETTAKEDPVAQSNGEAVANRVPFEFFKVFLASTSSERLLLPPAFGLVLGGKIPSKCSIEDPNKKIWEIGLGKLGVAFVIESGWDKFVIHHGLVNGDFLIFEFMGGCRFRVKIFCQNGMIKRSESNQDDSAAWSFIAPPSAKSVPEKRTRVKPKPIADNFVVISSSSDEEDNLPPVQINEFKTVLTDSTRYGVKLPTSFFPVITKKGDKITLINDDGKMWQVVLGRDGNRSTLGTGWRQFWMQNNVVYGDICIFKWTGSKEGDHGSFRVRISRSN